MKILSTEQVEALEKAGMSLRDIQEIDEKKFLENEKLRIALEKYELQKTEGIEKGKLEIEERLTKDNAHFEQQKRLFKELEGIAPTGWYDFVVTTHKPQVVKVVYDPANGDRVEVFSECYESKSGYIKCLKFTDKNISLANHVTYGSGGWGRETNHGMKYTVSDNNYKDHMYKKPESIHKKIKEMYDDVVYKNKVRKGKESRKDTAFEQVKSWLPNETVLLEKTGYYSGAHGRNRGTWTEQDVIIVGKSSWDAKLKIVVGGWYGDETALTINELKSVALKNAEAFIVGLVNLLNDLPEGK